MEIVERALGGVSHTHTHTQLEEITRSGESGNNDNEAKRERERRWSTKPQKWNEEDADESPVARKGVRWSRERER